tara:strand:- start:158 stop:469 length:312 start_codon:yes stop_codon:yes gene_type:complete
MKIKGKFKKLLKLESGVSKAGKEWKKQSFILDTLNEYNPDLCIDAFGERLNDIQNIEEGSLIECDINISSREWKEKWFTSASLFKIRKLDTNNSEESSEDLPF